MGNFDDIIKHLKGLEDDVTQHPEKYFDLVEQEDNSMTLLDSESEALLKRILENDKDFPEVLANMLKDLDCAAKDRLLAIINVLEKGGYIKMRWADNLPYYGRIEQKGRAYFEMKEREETKSRDYLADRLNGVVEATGNIYTQNFYGDVVESNIQQATIGSTQTIEKQFPDVASIVSEIRKEIETYKLNAEQKVDLLETVDEIEKAEKAKNKSKVKQLLFGVCGILKDLCVGVAAGYWASKM